ncbi:MAG: type I DNA topoisomerase [Corallococcus sp.]|nr:type I DNA topoisomerase [Corallococcus sp.]MCM1359479.1 type I DNA topoisomerase [Corallococcus sp.]MCM1394709.1 type I DNA topoisomerase [Corallococcus sp.]
MKLVIVESPAKAKTIGKYLGSNYRVDASRGHIWDLPEKTMGIDFDNNYEPELSARKPEQKQTIDRLAQEVKKAECVFLATDPDREGEAISYHLQCALGLDPNQKNRIMFNEISKKAVNEAIQHPDYVNQGLVNAQQARRVLDRLVGYTLSPVLCKKIRNKLSAGRVQSAALRIVVDREKEISAFKPEEFWAISALLEKAGVKPQFKVALTEKNGKKIKIKNKEECDAVLAVLNAEPFVVGNVKKSVSQSRPQPPFTTSTLQQDAVNKLRMTSAMAMSVAQQLYEGFDIPGMGHVALVTYIRTDSVRVSTDAVNAARERLSQVYGSKYVPEKPNFFATKKQAQDAHEAIRPINLDITPEFLKDKVQKNQYALYKLIYERFLASQAEKASYNSVSVSVNCGEYGLTANGKTLLFDGYLAIYGDTKAKEDDDGDNAVLPPLEVGDNLNKVKINSEQRFTKPPARYTEASLIKAMEERGIGRPSTYATVMQTLYKREYVTKDGKALLPSNLGMHVTDYLEQYFSEIVDVDFTAEMESRLDSIEENGEVWYKVVESFYKPLEQKVNVALKGEKIRVQDEESDVVCEKCGSPMVIKTGRYGKYLACTNYPQCSNMRSLKEKVPPKETEQICELCGAKMLERVGRYGKYLACSNFPTCKNTKPLNETVAKCPKCGKDVAKRISKRGTVFYGCTGYPECDFVSWDIPTGKLCPDCGKHLVYKETKSGKVIRCSNKDCKYEQEVPSES